MMAKKKIAPPATKKARAKKSQATSGASLGDEQAASCPSKSLESWIRDAACSIRGAKDAPKYSRAERERLPKAAHRADAGASVSDYILPLISPSRTIHTGDAETYRPIAEIVEELEAIDLSAEASAKEEDEARETDNGLKEILEKSGV